MLFSYNGIAYLGHNQAEALSLRSQERPEQDCTVPFFGHDPVFYDLLEAQPDHAGDP